MIRNAILLLISLASIHPGALFAQIKSEPQESEIERQARLARRGAGLRVGARRVGSLRDTPGGTSSTMPTLEAWHQRGLDRHVALDNSIAFWGRRETVTQSGGPLGGTSEQSVGTYVVPLLTSVQLHPVTGPDSTLLPLPVPISCPRARVAAQVQGTAEILTTQTMHGYWISKHIQRLSMHKSGGRYAWPPPAE